MDIVGVMIGEKEPLFIERKTVPESYLAPVILTAAPSAITVHGGSATVKS